MSDIEEWEKLFQDYVNLDKEVLTEIALQSYDKILRYYEQRGQHEWYQTLAGLLTVFITNDHKVDYSEYELYNAIAVDKFDYDSFYDFCCNIHKKFSNRELEDMIRELPNEVRKNVIQIGLCLCSVNETITADEKRLILRLSED
jgi:hypothetical protein